MSAGLSTYLAKVSLALAACLILLVPFSDPFRNIDFQGGVLITSGSCAWLALLQRRLKLDRYASVGLGLFVISCLLSLLVNPHFGYDLFGAPYLRLGAAGLLSCIGIGWLLACLKPKRLMHILYSLLVAVAALSVPYSLWRFGVVLRLPGLVAQTDVLATLAAVGWLLGLQLWRRYPKYRKWLAVTQVSLLSVLLLTETRAVIVITIGLSLAWLWQHANRRVFWSGLAITGLLLGLGSLTVSNSRLTNPGYANQSVAYRLSLQQAALAASAHKPWLGYGPGNLADALACKRLKAPALEATCRQGYFFNSSHNIFIDRALAVGWVGGAAYAGLVISAVYRGLRDSRTRIFGYATLLIAGYYLTNVTSVVLELLLWVLLFQCWRRPSHA